MSNLKQLVLNSFKKLHRTSQTVFAGDEKALIAARVKINEEYSKTKLIKDEEAIKAMVKLGEDVAKELKAQVIQAKKIRPGVYMAKITKDTIKFDNKPFVTSAVEEKQKDKNTNRPCCQNEAGNK
ncbi:hypothetical protein evm_004165 [Chilo suppressalis]|nr:hypothetical protein evm_004165 [Chilo suppressalis]